MKKLAKLILLSFLIFFCENSLGQKVSDSLLNTVNSDRMSEQEYYQQKLGIDRAKSVQVAAIVAAYQDSIRAIQRGLAPLKGGARKEKLLQLLMERHRKLREILNPSRVVEIDPTTGNTQSTSE